MQLKGKTILAAGMGKSGKAVINTLINKGAIVQLYDQKKESEIDPIVMSLVANYKLKTYFNNQSVSMRDVDILVVSPGIPLDTELVVEAKTNNVEVIGELELAYRLSEGKFVAITGTNGKTTTTALVGEIFAQAQKEHFVVGNIGVAAISKAEEVSKEGYMITEVSSFQLETTSTFLPIVSAVLNITEDHLNRHKTMEKYIEAKANIYQNQEKEQYFVVNFDNELAYKMAEGCRGTIIPFSRKEKLDQGIYVEDDKIVIKTMNGEIIPVFNIKELKIPGTHNLENALAAVGIAYYSGIEIEAIKKGLDVFSGVEHRIELVDEIEGVKYINDSKGTNPDASINAVRAMSGPTILIAGGMDKGSTFDTFIDAFEGKIKYMVLLGETAEIIKNTAEKKGFTHVILRKNMKECVEEAHRLSESGDTVLLSPACASWDMYPNFETRGEDFRNCVSALR